MHIQFEQDFHNCFVQGNSKKCGQRLLNKEVHCTINYIPKYPKRLNNIQPEGRHRIFDTEKCLPYIVKLKNHVPDLNSIILILIFYIVIAVYEGQNYNVLLFSSLYVSVFFKFSALNDHHSYNLRRNMKGFRKQKKASPSLRHSIIVEIKSLSKSRPYYTS